MRNICYNVRIMKTVFFLQSSKWPSNLAELNGAAQSASDFGWNLRVVEFRKDSRDKKNAVFLETFARLRQFWDPIGIIVDSGGAPTEFSRRDFRLPVIFLDRHPKTIEKDAICVCSDARKISHLAARELLMLNAATYGYVPFFKPYVWSLERGREFKAALQLNGIPCKTLRLTRAIAYDDEYLDCISNWLTTLAKPVALLSANDYIGEMVVNAAIKAGLRIPEDVAVMGVDNDEEICRRSFPTLSSISIDHEKAGHLAVELLREQILKPRRRPMSQAFGPTAVFHRGSTKTLRRHDERSVKLVEMVRKQALGCISVQQLAQSFGVTPRMIEILFHQATGHSIREDIQRIRLEKAKVLLSSSRARLPDIARLSGYPTYQAFRKTFTLSVGFSPSKWRKTNSNEES